MRTVASSTECEYNVVAQSCMVLKTLNRYGLTIDSKVVGRVKFIGEHSHLLALKLFLLFSERR